MTTSVLFIQGAGEGTYAADQKLADSLRTALGADFDVLYPRMPDEDSPRYEAWKSRILRELTPLEGRVIAAGHSFGASILLKVLSEVALENHIEGIFLAAAPYWGAADWEVEEYALRDGFAAKLPRVPLYLYHSQDDEIVPFSHLMFYVDKLPNALTRHFNGRGHQFNDDLSEMAGDILRLREIMAG